MTILQRLVTTAVTLSAAASIAAPALASQDDKTDDALRGSGRVVPADVQHNHCNAPENPLCTPKG